MRATPALAVPLLMMTLIGCLAYEFQVVLPIVASETFAGDARAYGFLTAAMGAGAVLGGLWVAARGRTGMPALVGASTAFGLAMAAAALAPDMLVALLAMGLVGATSVAFLSMSNSTLQLVAEPHMRGPGDGPVGGRVPRLHADRRPDRGRGQRALRRPRGARPRRGGLPGRRRSRCADPAPPARAAGPAP